MGVGHTEDDRHIRRKGPDARVSPVDEAIAQHQHAGNAAQTRTANTLDIVAILTVDGMFRNDVTLQRMKDVFQRQRNLIVLDLAVGSRSLHVTPAVRESEWSGHGMALAGKRSLLPYQGKDRTGKPSSSGGDC